MKPTIMRFLLVIAVCSCVQAAVATSSNLQFHVLQVPGASRTVAYGLNNLGQIVGTYTAAGVGHGFLYDSGVFTTIDDPQGTGTLVTGINDGSEVVGYSSARGFSELNGVYTSISYPGSKATFPSSVNNSGDIVGSYDDGQGKQHGFLFSNGVYTTIDPPNSAVTLLGGINNNRIIAGTVCLSTTRKCHGFIYSQGRFAYVTYPGSVGAQVLGLNDAVDLAGDEDSASGLENDFTYSTVTGKFVGFEVANSRDTAAYGINNSGEVVGFFTQGATFSGYYLQPTAVPNK